MTAVVNGQQQWCPRMCVYALGRRRGTPTSPRTRFWSTSQTSLDRGCCGGSECTFSASGAAFTRAHPHAHTFANALLGCTWRSLSQVVTGIGYRYTTLPADADAARHHPFTVVEHGAAHGVWCCHHHAAYLPAASVMTRYVGLH